MAADPERPAAPVVDPALAARYRNAGWWGTEPLSAHVARHARHRPADVAYYGEHDRLTWSDYDGASDRIAGALIDNGLRPGDRAAVLLPDGPQVHVAYLANEKAGLTTVGIGARSGQREIRDLLARTHAGALVTTRVHRGRDTGEMFDGLRLVYEETRGRPRDWSGRRLGPDDLWLINTTSGTTGLPKCVMHTQNRWVYFHTAAVDAARLTAGDVMMSVVPAPFGFGLWTAHVTPTLLGVPCVVMARFDAAAALRLVEEHRVTVLCAVTTQFVMMLNSPEFPDRDLTSLRVLFTGGEMVPYEKAKRFEEVTGAAVLQFYGSNESGLATGTRLDDPQERRLRTSGRVVPGTELRLFADGRDVTATGRGQPGTRGPATCIGYLDDVEANAQLFTADGFLLHADVCTIDGEGWLSVIGRTADLIIRGGKNISAAQVEDEVTAHPAVALAAAVPVPDEVFGERVCVFAELRPGATLTLEELIGFLAARGTSPELLPERLEVLAALPRSAGGKIAKGELRRRLTGGD